MSSPFDFRSASDEGSAERPTTRRRPRKVSLLTVVALCIGGLLVLAVTVAVAWWTLARPQLLPGGPGADLLAATLELAEAAQVKQDEAAAIRSKLQGGNLERGSAEKTQASKGVVKAETAIVLYNDALRTLVRYEQVAGPSRKTAELDSRIRLQLDLVETDRGILKRIHDNIPWTAP